MQYLKSLYFVHPAVDSFDTFDAPAPCGQPGALETWQTQSETHNFGKDMEKYVKGDSWIYNM